MLADHDFIKCKKTLINLTIIATFKVLVKLLYSMDLNLDENLKLKSIYHYIMSLLFVFLCILIIALTSGLHTSNRYKPMESMDHGVHGVHGMHGDHGICGIQ